MPLPSPATRRVLLDVGLASVLCVTGLVEVFGVRLAEDVVRGPVWLNVVTVLLTTLPLCVRRQAPLLVTVVIFATLASRALVSEPLEIYPPQLAALVAAYSVGAYAPLPRALVGYVVAVAGIAVAATHGTGGDATPDLVASVILLLTVWAIGQVVSRRYSEVADVAQQAEALHRRREEETRLAVEAERARIARDLHDSVAHSLAMIAIQAGGAASVLERDPERAARSLRSIETTARTGLTEMRHLLHLVGADEQPREPQPGIEQIADLVAGAAAAGLDVRLTTAGGETLVAPGVALAAYRIVQEALTNAAKHAGDGPTSVSLAWGDGDLTVVVTSQGRASDSTPGAGRGLVGMRERALVVGGRLESGPDASGAFRVVATLPTGVSA